MQHVERTGTSGGESTHVAAPRGFALRRFWETLGAHGLAVREGVPATPEDGPDGCPAELWGLLGAGPATPVGAGDDECWRLLTVAEAKALRAQLLERYDDDRGPELFRREWWPMLLNGCGDVVCFDAERGEVREVQHDAADRPKLGTTLEDWLERVTEAVREGVLVVEEDGSLRVAAPVDWAELFELPAEPPPPPRRAERLGRLAGALAGLGLMGLMLAGRASRGRLSTGAFVFGLTALGVGLLAGGVATWRRRASS